MFSLQRWQLADTEEANNVGGATNWSLIDKFGNQILLELVVMLISLKRWFLAAER
jgi:hypothetical protein